MKLRWLFLMLAFVSACDSSGSRPKSRPLVVTDFPKPPQQHTKWDSETNLISSEFVSATKILFEQGLADPRGCDYREVEIQVGDVWRGDGGNVKTHGWVLPNASNSNQTFAVCWNGLVYPVVSVGAQTNLQADMELFMASATTNVSKMRMAFYGGAISEKMSVAQDSPLPIKACLLLRLGENDWAAKVWNAYGTSLENSHRQQPGKDPYLTLAGDWSWALFDRAICAHMRGDVPLALVSARKLAEIQPRIEAEAALRGFPRPQSYGNGMQKPKEQPYLPFLAQLPQLLAALERRANEPKEKSVIQIGLTNYPNQSDRIAALIEDLDLVNARQFGQPGWVATQTDPIVQSLIRESDPAVEPLLNCFENDKRLTCSVSFGRDFFRDRHVLTVAGTAKTALQEILRVQFQSAAEFRDYWSRNKGMKLEDRWYATLLDNQAGVRLWLQAARNIMQPDSETGVPGGGFYSSAPSKAGEKPKYRGEVLRSIGFPFPSVTKLLLKRATEVAEDAGLKDQFMGVDAIHNGTELVSILSQWDKPTTAVAPAQSLMRHAIDLWPNGTTFIMSSGHDLARYIPQLTEIRVEGSDSNALPEYAAWIKTADQEKIDEYAIEAFEPLCRNPNDPTVATVSEWLFNDPASSWSKLPWLRSTFHDPLDSDLVKLPAFRKLLARELENQAVIGSMQWQSGIGINVSYNISRASGGYHFDWPDAESPTNGTKVEIRRCDWVAWKLSSSKQTPFFNPFTTVESRDEAIKNAKSEMIKSK